MRVVHRFPFSSINFFTVTGISEDLSMAELIPPVISNERVAQIVQIHYSVSPIDPSCYIHEYEDRNYYI